MKMPLPETSHLIAHRALMAAWRAKSHAEQLAWFMSRSEAGVSFRADAGDRIRVGLCCPCIVQGGAEAWQLALARSVDSTRICWQGVVVVGDGIAVDPSMRTAFEQFMPIGSGRDAARELANECDVLVTWAIEDLPELVAGLSHPPKTVAVCHAPPESAWGQTVYARARPNRFVAVSELALEAIPAADRPGAAVIWNAVDESRLGPRTDTEETRNGKKIELLSSVLPPCHSVAGLSRSVAEMRAAWGVPTGAMVAGLYQRLSDEKDCWAALRLAASLPDDWRVVFVGQGWLRDELIRVKEEQRLDRLIFAGSDHDAGSVLRAFDCLLIPSDYESFCLSMAEALWVGTPVISTDVGLANMWKRSRGSGLGTEASHLDLSPESPVLSPFANVGLTRPIPFQADGPTLAAAVLADAADPVGTSARVGRAQSFARERLSLDRFGREWTEFLVGLGESARLLRVAACPDRGGVLPISMQDDCGCVGKELSECGQGRGVVAGRVTLHDCLVCQGSPDR